MIQVVVLLSIFSYLFRNELGSLMEGGPEFYQYDELYHRFSKQLGVPWRLIKAIAIVESQQGQASSVKSGILNPTDVNASVSSDGKSWGVMQTTLATARDMEGLQIQIPFLNVPENSIRIGTKYLAWLKNNKKFGLDFEKLARGYNGGPGYALTRLGPSLTAVYWAKVSAALALIQTRQPGNEMEIG